MQNVDDQSPGAFTVPLCRGHHREVHRIGAEAGWWKKSGIDPVAQARTLRLETRPLSVARQDGARRWAIRRCYCRRSDQTAPLRSVTVGDRGAFEVLWDIEHN